MTATRAFKRVTVEEQKPQLESTKIPLVERNLQTGWPLLQVSLFTPALDEQNGYDYVLGGGKCHDFCIGAYFFAQLLTKVDSHAEVKCSGLIMKKEEFNNVLNVGKLLNGYVVNSNKFKMMMREHFGAYGKTLEIQLPVGNEDAKEAFKVKLGELTSNKPFFITPGQQGIGLIGGTSSKACIAEKSIKDALNTEFAMFENGQIFIDLGAFLKQVKDDEIMDFFAGFFQVDQFKKTYNLASLETKAIPKPQPTETKEEVKKNAPVSTVQQLTEIAQLAHDSSESDEKKAELQKIITALKANPGLKQLQLQNAFKNILAITLQPSKRAWHRLSSATSAGRMIRGTLQQERFKPLIDRLNITISDERKGLRYRDLRGYLTGNVGKKATKWGGFFLSAQTTPVASDPLEHDATNIERFYKKTTPHK